MNTNYTIYGCGGHARSVADVILFNDPSSQLVFVDENAKEKEEIFRFPVVSRNEDFVNENVFVAIGDNIKREELIGQLGVHALVSVVSSDSTIGKDAKINSGSFVGHQVYIGPLAEISEGSILNTRVVVEHEVKIGPYSQLAPNVVIGGRTRIGRNVFIGLGAVIIDGLSVCDNVTIGAGSVVIDDITEPGMYAGIPAKRKK